MKTAVISFGRLNPITSGHQKLVDKIISVAKSKKATPLLFLSHSHDKKKNPLSYEQKIKYAKKAFGKVVQKSNSKTIIEVLKELQSKYDDIIVVVGSDRVSDFDSLLQRYNGKDYTYNSIQIVSAGERDPDADDVSGMSASKLRSLAAMGDYNKFKTGLPRKFNESDAKQIYNDIRAAMKIKEEIQIDEVLTIQQRIKRKMIMRRIRSRIKRGAKIARRRMAKPEKLKVRSGRAARTILRKRLAGNLGANYANLTPSAKIQVDKRLEKKKGMIAKLAKRLLPKVRKAEVERLQKARKAKNESIDYLLTVNAMLTNIEKKNISEKVEKNLVKKSEKYNISIDELKEAYIEYKSSYAGEDNQEVDRWAFNQLNASIVSAYDIDDATIEESVASVLDQIDPKLGRVLDRILNKKAYTKAIRFYLDYRKQYPGKAQQNLVKVAKMTGADYRNLEIILHDMVKKGKLPKHLAFNKNRMNEAAVDAKGHKSSTGGLTQKGRDHYNRKTGGNLKAPVTTKPSKLDPDSKSAKRRKSFCARMSGVEGPMKDEKGRPTRKALALRKWNC
jgi:nicotinic acid mononucleotide adenylyltransferase